MGTAAWGIHSRMHHACMADYMEASQPCGQCNSTMRLMIAYDISCMRGVLRAEVVHLFCGAPLVRRFLSGGVASHSVLVTGLISSITSTIIPYVACCGEHSWPLPDIPLVRRFLASKWRTPPGGVRRHPGPGCLQQQGRGGDSEGEGRGWQ